MKRVGIVGCGSIASTHAWVLKQMPGVELAGFADTIIARAEDFSDTYTDQKAAGLLSLGEEMRTIIKTIGRGSLIPRVVVL